MSLITDLTLTAQRKIAREIRDVVGDATTVRASQLQPICSRHGVRRVLVEDLAESLGILVITDMGPEPGGPSVPTPGAAAHRPPAPSPRSSTSLQPSGVRRSSVPDCVSRSIVRGDIYSLLQEPDGDEPEERAFVVTTYGRWRRERQAIIQLMREGGLLR